MKFINVLLLLIQVSRCQDKTDLKIVLSCPTSKEEWDSAAQKKNCSKFGALDTHEEQYVYHCLINAYLNETVEVCAPKKKIHGYCTEFNVAGRYIQHHEEAKCNETYPRCDETYFSTDAYKYPDCYQIVYDNRNKYYTTYLPPEKTTLVKSKDMEDNGNTEAIAAAIASVIIVIMIIAISVILFIKKKRTEKKRNEFDKEEVIPLRDIEAVNTTNEEKRTEKKRNEFDKEEVIPLRDIEAVNTTNEVKRTEKKRNEFDKEEVIPLRDIEAVNTTNEGEESIEYFLFNVKDFEHFKYICNLTRGYTKNEFWSNEMQLEDVIFKIGVVGEFNDDNLKLFPKVKTKVDGKIQNVWEAVPVLCFQNDLTVQSALETLRQTSASHYILVTSKPVCETDRGDDSIIIIGQNKDEIMKAITFCLEQPFRHMLEKLLNDLPTKDSSRLASTRSGEIKALLKEMTFDNNEETVKENIPENLQDYLSRSDGFKRAKLSPSSLDVLVDKTTDEEIMKDDMTKLNASFLERFPLTIQKGTLIKQNTGGFVKATDNDKKKNNSTCGHVVPKGNKVVYTKGRNAPKKYKNDTEQEKEMTKDVKDSHRKKTENNTVDSPSLNTAVSTKKDTKLYGPRYLDFCLVEVLLLFGLLLSFKRLWNSDGIIEEPLD